MNNHHYVSQCHLREFFNEAQGSIYVYDKNQVNFYTKKSTRYLFSEKESNSKVIDGVIDHQQMENELKDLFEDDFPKNLKIITQFIENQNSLEEAYRALNYMAFLGLVGEYRNPIYKLALDNAAEKLSFDVLGSNLKPESLKKKQTKYSNTAGYLNIVSKILEEISPLIFSIYVIASNDHFLLPDTSCFQSREYGDIGKIIEVGIPLSDKIFVLATSKSVQNTQSEIVTFHDDNSDDVLDINTYLANFAYKGVACSDMDFLKNTISRIREGNR